MPAFAKMRDKNEGVIVEALVKAGASVTKIGDMGTPDLLVGFRGQTFLIEVKNPDSKGGSANHNSSGGRGYLTKAQVKFWDGWKGASPSIVMTPEEALAAIGVENGEVKQ